MKSPLKISNNRLQIPKGQKSREDCSHMTVMASTGGKNLRQNNIIGVQPAARMEYAIVNGNK